MPATLTSPLTQPNVPRLRIVSASFDFEADVVSFTFEQIDNSTPPVVLGPPLRASSTFSSFVTAFQAATGNAKQKAYTAALAAAGLTASSIT